MDTSLVRCRWPDMTPAEIDSFIQGHSWRFAHTMPWCPHWYVVKRNCRDPKEFERFVLHIRRHGERGRYNHHYFDWRDPDGTLYQYWTRGKPLTVTTIINRSLVKP